MNTKNKTGSNQEIVNQQNESIEKYSKELFNLQEQIKSAEGLFRKHGKDCLDLAIKAGGVLHKIKTLMNHGQWLVWLTGTAEDMGVTVRTLQNYMMLSEKNETGYVFDDCEGLKDAYEKIRTQAKNKPNVNEPQIKENLTKEQIQSREANKIKQMKDEILHKVKRDMLHGINWDISTWKLDGEKQSPRDENNCLNIPYYSSWVSENKQDIVYWKVGILISYILQSIVRETNHIEAETETVKKEKAKADEKRTPHNPNLEKLLKDLNPIPINPEVIGPKRGEKEEELMPPEQPLPNSVCKTLCE